MEFKKTKWLCQEIIKFYENEQKNVNIPKNEREKLTNLRLQKILFFLYGYYWKEEKQEILNLEFKAWQYGPVVNELYDFIIAKLDKNRYNPIELKWFEENEKHKYDKKIFEKILNHLSQFSTIRLVNASHETDPWLKTSYNEIIDNNLIKKWFEENVSNIE